MTDNVIPINARGNDDLWQSKLPLEDQNPHDALIDQQMEQSLLGFILSRPDALDQIPQNFRADHYSIPLHAEIHRAVAASSTGEARDEMPLARVIAIHTDPKDRVYIAKLVETIYGQHPSTIGLYADRLTELHRKRGMLAIINHARESVLHDTAASPQYMIGKTVSSLEMLMGDAEAATTASFDEALAGAMAEIQAAIHRGGPIGVLTGMPSVDDLIGGMEPGTLHLLAGRPGMGKSALGFQWALHRARQAKLAMDAGHPPAGVFVGSCEMTKEQLAIRVLAAETGINLSDLRHGRVTDQMIALLIAAQKQLAGLPMTIDDAFGQTIDVLGIKANAAKRKHGLSLAVIDHAHIIKADKDVAKQGRTVEVGAVADGAKGIAKRLGVPVLLLAQLSRLTEGREDKRPTLGDLRWAGELEQNAETVSFVYREAHYLGHTPPDRRVAQTLEAHQKEVDEWHRKRERLADKAELIVTKSRQGKPGTALLSFIDTLTKFHDPASAVGAFEETE